MTDQDRRADMYADSPSEISWEGWKRVIMRAAVRASDVSVSLSCAGVAFFSFLSVFPMVAIFVLMYGLIATPADIASQLSSVQSLIPSSVHDILTERLQALVDEPDEALGIGLLVSIALALWSGSRGVNALMHALDMANREKNQRSFLMNAIMSVGLTLGALVFLLTAIGAIAVLPALLSLAPIDNSTEILASTLRWPILALLVLMMFAALLRHAPDRTAARFTWLWPGAFLATVLWMGLSAGFSFYVENYGSYGATFGALSSAVVLMLWLYYSTLAVTFSAMVNAEAELETRRDTTTGVRMPIGERGAYVADYHIDMVDDGNITPSDRN